MNDDPMVRVDEVGQEPPRRHDLSMLALPAPRNCREALCQIHQAWLYAGRNSAAGDTTLALRDALSRQSAGGGPDGAVAVLQTLIDTLDHCLADTSSAVVRDIIRRSATSCLVEAILCAVGKVRPLLRFAEPTFLARLDALVAAGRREVDLWRNGA